jgi:hypothetical protein
MKRNLTENKPQRYRAIAIYANGDEGLLYLGQNFNQVQEGYDIPYFELLTSDERAKVAKISLQKWMGMPDAGRWEDQRELPIPQDVEMPLLAIVAKPKKVPNIFDE